MIIQFFKFIPIEDDNTESSTKISKSITTRGIIKDAHYSIQFYLFLPE